MTLERERSVHIFTNIDHWPGSCCTGPPWPPPWPPPRSPPPSPWPPSSAPPPGSPSASAHRCSASSIERVTKDYHRLWKRSCINSEDFWEIFWIAGWGYLWLWSQAVMLNFRPYQAPSEHLSHFSQIIRGGPWWGLKSNITAWLHNLILLFKIFFQKSSELMWELFLKARGNLWSPFHHYGSLNCSSPDWAEAFLMM